MKLWRRLCRRCGHPVRDHIGRRYSCLADAPGPADWCPCAGVQR